LTPLDVRTLGKYEVLLNTRLKQFCDRFAVAMVHSNFGFFMNWTGTQKGEGFEYHLLALAVTVFLMIRGAGAFSVDRLVATALPTVQPSLAHS
jgi:hypothetical protein